MASFVYDGCAGYQPPYESTDEYKLKKAKARIKSLEKTIRLLRRQLANREDTFRRWHPKKEKRSIGQTNTYGAANYEN